MSGQSKPAATYVAVSQITPLFNIAVSQNSPLNMRRLVKCRPLQCINIRAASQIAPLFYTAVSKNSPLNSSSKNVYCVFVRVTSLFNTDNFITGTYILIDNIIAFSILCLSYCPHPHPLASVVGLSHRRNSIVLSKLTPPN
jgi:hypothetical protein